MTSALPENFDPLCENHPVHGPRGDGPPPASKSSQTPVSIVRSKALDPGRDQGREMAQHEDQNMARNMEASSLAHDARNWLTVLQVYCDLLHTSGPGASGYQKWIEELSTAVTRGYDLVASLLHSVQDAQPGSGSINFTPQDAFSRQRSTNILDLSEALERRLPLLQQLAGNRIKVGVVTLDPMDTLAKLARGGRVALSEGDFDRILHNLVGNAIEAMPQGGQLRITLTRGRAPSSNPKSEAGKLPRNAAIHRRSELSSAATLLLQVFDSGDGISSKLLPHVFEAGVSSKIQANNATRGYGLAIVQDLTQRAGGSIHVRSKPRGGTCFSIELPFVQQGLPGKLPAPFQAPFQEKARSSRPKQKSSLHTNAPNSSRLDRARDHNCSTVGKEPE